MKVENQVQARPANIKAFLAGKPEPIVMVNLIKFRSRAKYKDGRKTDLTGRAAYELYAREMHKLIGGSGGRFVFGGDVESLLLGEVEELWDSVGLAEYPSPQALIEIASSPQFQKIEVHREAGLAGQLNIAVRSTTL